MGGWFGGVEQRFGGPRLADIVDATVGVFEQVGGLSIDFKRVVAGEQIKVEHPGLSMSVLHTNTNGYKRDHQRMDRLEGFNSGITSVWLAGLTTVSVNSHPGLGLLHSSLCHEHKPLASCGAGPI
jgi:hypothetical protein